MLFAEQKLVNQEPTFDELTSERQRGALNRRLCGKYGVPSGTAIPYKVCQAERRGGVYWADMRAEYNGAAFEFNVQVLNKSGQIAFAEGFRLARKELRLVRAG